MEISPSKYDPGIGHYPILDQVIHVKEPTAPQQALLLQKFCSLSYLALSVEPHVGFTSESAQANN